MRQRSRSHYQPYIAFSIFSLSRPWKTRQIYQLCLATAQTCKYWRQRVLLETSATEETWTTSSNWSPTWQPSSSTNWSRTRWPTTSTVTASRTWPNSLSTETAPTSWRAWRPSWKRPSGQRQRPTSKRPAKRLTAFTTTSTPFTSCTRAGRRCRCTTPWGRCTRWEDSAEKIPTPSASTA